MRDGGSLRISIMDMGRGNKTNEMDTEGKDRKQLVKFFLENWVDWGGIFWEWRI